MNHAFWCQVKGKLAGRKFSHCELPDKSGPIPHTNHEQSGGQVTSNN